MTSKDKWTLYDQVYLELTTFRLIMIPIGDVFDLAHKPEYQSIHEGIIKGYHTIPKCLLEGMWW